MTNLETFEFNPETETYETEWGGEAEVFSEAETMELAGELLEITTEAELDRFLGDLISKAGQAVGKFVRSPIGNAVGGWLKGAAKSALPLAGGALGDAELTAALQEHVKREIAPYKYPRAIEYVEALPKTETGKLRRFALRQMAASRAVSSSAAAE